MANFKLLDVGCGHGIFLSDMSSVYKLHCVGVESNKIHFQASVELLAHQIKQMKGSYSFPFYPVFGDGRHLKDFGGAEIIYAWIEGAPCDLHQHLFKTFVEDKHAHVFVSDYCEPDHDTYRTSLECRMSHKGGSRTLYFYVKTGPMERVRDRNSINDEDSVKNKVRIAFCRLKKFRQCSDKTLENMMEIVNPLQQESQPAKKKEVRANFVQTLLLTPNPN